MRVIYEPDDRDCLPPILGQRSGDKVGLEGYIETQSLTVH